MTEILDKIMPYEAGAELLWAMEFQEKLLLRFTGFWEIFQRLV